MTRRGLFGMLGAAVAAATLDPERLLWEPGKKLISIPKPDPDWPVPFLYRGIWPEITRERLIARYGAAKAVSAQLQKWGQR
jgi:hypothetical protein